MVGCILPRAESSLDLGGFLKKQSEVMRFRGLLIPEGQISLQCLLRGLLAMVNCYIENRAIRLRKRSGRSQIMQRLREPTLN